MLTKIEISNINAIDKFSISFEKSKCQYHDEMIFNDDLVNPIAFYGANGSGKTSVLRAMSQLVAMLIDEPEDISPFIINFAKVKFNKDKKFEISDVKSYVKVFFKLQNANYTYKLETSTRIKITHEQLLKDKSVIFDRTATKYKYLNEEHEIESPMFPLLRKLSLETNDATIQSVFQFLSNICFINAASKTYKAKIFKQKSYMDVIVERSKDVKAILTKYREFPLYNIISLPGKLGKKEYLAEIQLDNGSFALPWDFVSSGMASHSMLLSVVLSLPENGVLLIDEIESTIHPLTILDFINVVREKNIQLIFSSHNTYILQKLRPDQIFFAHWNNGYSTYSRLNEIYPNIREINNIEKMYLSNMFEDGIKKDV